MQWSPFDVNMIATASKDEKCCIWNISHINSDCAAEPIFIHGGHSSMVYEISWHINEKYLLCSVDSGNNVHIWKVAKDLVKAF